MKKHDIIFLGEIMSEYFSIYELNKQLDAAFDKLYDINNPEIRLKNFLELLVELGELANETRVFKYWSSKDRSSDEVVLDEFADCLIMVLSFAEILEIEIDKVKKVKIKRNVIEQFIYLYEKSAKLQKNFTKPYVSSLMAETVNLAYLLGYNDQIIIDACYKKIKRNFKRFETNFNE